MSNSLRLLSSTVTNPPGHPPRDRIGYPDTEWGNEGYGDEDHSMAGETMGTDRLPPGIEAEPNDGMSWDGDAVKSLQAGRLPLAPAFPLACILDSSCKGRCSRNTLTAGPTPR